MQAAWSACRFLNGMTNVARRKVRMTWFDIHALLSAFSGPLAVRPITIETRKTGLAFAERYDLSTYDAIITASALLADCDVLWSEDMQDGMTVGGGLRVVNPCRGMR
jgi:predicted nucleic acid-binding protein